ncbi:hypothetical protein [Nocardia wallacei]|uniref:hypothetical protein n=1 Tax=Nocardia wallacei TaxID=480035 RepID=UPI00245911F2|nr:hypothetical protein [Nocardia wallacei]
MVVRNRLAAERWLKRTGSALVVGAVPLALVLSATPAAADPAGDTDTIAQQPAPPGDLAAVGAAILRLPAPAAAPIPAPDNTIRIGSVVVGRPDFIDPQTTTQINDAAANAEAGLAQSLDSAGFEPERSDRMAADTLGGAATGAAVGAVASAPLAATSALVGSVAGLVAGVPFLPIGLLIGPVVGAQIGAAVITVPAAAAGAAIGAAAGAIGGYVAPLAEPPAVPAAEPAA